MPTRDDPDFLVDTSVAVALVLTSHEHHTAVTRALRGQRLGLAGHAAFETFSVLTRLPAPDRRTPAAVHSLFKANFPSSRFLGSRASRALLDELPLKGIAGGSIYDALVGAAAREHDITLATGDRRALSIYRALGVRTRFIS